MDHPAVQMLLSLAVVLMPLLAARWLLGRCVARRRRESSAAPRSRRSARDDDAGAARE